MIRVYGSPFRHRVGTFAPMSPIAWTSCGIRFCWMPWPKGAPKPRLTRCGECFA